MGRGNRNSSNGSTLPARHRQAMPDVDEGSAYAHPSHTAEYSMNGTSYFPHPCGYHGANVDDQPENYDSSNSRQGTQIEPVSRFGGAKRPSISSTRVPSNPIHSMPRSKTSISAELKISLAAKQLATQTSESKRFWITFQEMFDKDVAGIKHYISDSILQQIWQKKIEHNDKCKNGDNHDGEQFSMQQMKLEACLEQLDEATKAFKRSQQLDDPLDHDPRRLALEKVRAAGDLVLGLATKAVANIAACADLVTEASSLEKLVDPMSSESKVLHQLGRRETGNAMPAGECLDPISTEREPSEVQDMFLDEL